MAYLIDKQLNTPYKSAPEGSRTPNLLIRSEMLYPVKLREHSFKKERKYKTSTQFLNRFA